MKNLTKTYFRQLDFIPTLLRYFALSPEYRVTVPGCFDNVKITFYQDDNGKYHRIVDNGFGEPVDLTYSDGIEVPTLLAIISHLDTLKPTDGHSYFGSMKEEILAKSVSYVTFDD